MLLQTIYGKGKGGACIADKVSISVKSVDIMGEQVERHLHSETREST